MLLIYLERGDLGLQGRFPLCLVLFDLGAHEEPQGKRDGEGYGQYSRELQHAGDAVLMASPDEPGFMDAGHFMLLPISAAALMMTRRVAA